MKRQEKYQDTSTFHYFNANPKNKVGDDCVVRAISTALHQSWEQTVRELTEVGIKYGYVLNDPHTYKRYLKDKGWIMQKQPRKEDNTKYTGDEFCKILQKDILSVGNTVIANIGGQHIVCIKETDDMLGLHKIHDIWNCTDYCIGNYWIKQDGEGKMYE